MDQQISYADAAIEPFGACAEIRTVGEQACPSGSPPLVLTGGFLYNLNDQGEIERLMTDAYAPLKVPVQSLGQP